MKLIIDIPKDAYDWVMGCGYFPTNFNMIYEIRHGTPIPDNATVCDIDCAIKSEGYMRGVNDDRNLWEHRIKQIRAEIDGIEINGQVDEHTMFIRTGEQVKQMALDIIDNLTEGE